MHYVIAEFNTDENNKWVYDDRILQGEPLPMSIFGPFEDFEKAMKYAEDFMPDDTDVHDVYVTSGPPEEGWVVNDPEEYSYHGMKPAAA